MFRQLARAARPAVSRATGARAAGPASAAPWPAPPSFAVSRRARLSAEQMPSNLRPSRQPLQYVSDLPSILGSFVHVVNDTARECAVCVACLVSSPFLSFIFCQVVADSSIAVSLSVSLSLSVALARSPRMSRICIAQTERLTMRSPSLKWAHGSLRRRRRRAWTPSRIHHVEFGQRGRAGAVQVLWS